MNTCVWIAGYTLLTRKTCVFRETLSLCHCNNHSCIRTDVGSNSVLRIKRLTAKGLNHDMASDSKFVINKSQTLLLLMSTYSQNALFKYLVFLKSEKVAHIHANSL